MTDCRDFDGLARFEWANKVGVLDRCKWIAWLNPETSEGAD